MNKPGIISCIIMLGICASSVQAAEIEFGTDGYLRASKGLSSGTTYADATEGWNAGLQIKHWW